MKSLNAISVVTRLGLVFASLAVLILINTGLLYWQQHQHAADTDSLLADDVEKLRLVDRWAALSRETSLRIMAVNKSGDPALGELFNPEIGPMVKEVGTLYGQLRSMSSDPQELAWFDAMTPKREALLKALGEVNDYKNIGDIAGAAAMFDTAFMPAQQAYNVHIQAFEKLESTLLQQKIEAQRRQAQRRSLLVMGGAVGLGALILMLAVGITSHIRRSLTRAVAVARAVADGDLSERPQVEGRDEFAGLMQSLSDMSDSLQAIVASVREGTDNIAMASAEIAQGNQDLSARTESQASAIEQTSASMEQLSATVRHNADHATQATELALDASQVAERGGDVVASVVSTMGGISEASKKISDIIGVIDGIAFQTNILALNAAVEAARAGEQGRGFAVVAGEVRSLAGRSAQAAREIKSLISDSAERVERGSTLVAQAGDTMADVVGRIHKVAELMKDVRQASSQQSAGVAQVGEAVHQMDQSTQQNAALVEQVSAAASSLESQSRRLVEAVSVFQIQPAGAGRPVRQDTRPRALMAGPAHKALPG